MKIKWDEDDEEFVGIVDDGIEEMPQYAKQGSNAAALVQGRYDYRFEEPIWLHPQTAYELDEAGIIEMHPEQSTDVDGITVYIYVTP